MTTFCVGALAAARLAFPPSAFDTERSWFGTRLVIGDGEAKSRIITSIPATLATDGARAGVVAISPRALLPARPNAAETAYFIVVFAYEDSHADHVFATFMKATSRDQAFEKVDYVRSNTISWLPADGTVDASDGAERGRNYTLRETLHEALLRGNPVKAFGPYRITARLYNKAMTQIRRLESRTVKFQATETEARQMGFAIHDVHALTDIDTSNGLAQTGGAQGEKASRLVIQHFATDLVSPEKTFDRLMDHLAIADFKIEKKPLSPQELQSKR